MNLFKWPSSKNPGRDPQSKIMRSGKSIDIDILNAGYRYALSLSTNRQDAEDLVHDAWIRLDNRYHKAPERTLLYTTIRNLYIDGYRRSKKIQFRAYEEELHAPESSVPGNITAEEMDRFLHRLRDVEREALYLSIVEGYTADEISKMTRTARGTILSMIHRSKIKLKKWMAGENIHGVNDTKAEVVELITGGLRDGK